MTIKAEPGFPMPEFKKGIEPKYPWKTMEVGESFPFDGTTGYSQACINSQKLAPKTFRCGRYDGKFRIWRVK